MHGGDVLCVGNRSLAIKERCRSSALDGFQFLTTFVSMSGADSGQVCAGIRGPERERVPIRSRQLHSTGVS